MKSRIPVAFAFSVFLSAALVFLVQPMSARLLLPQFGGSPAVWNACTVFFQTALLVGYCYTHLATRWLRPSRQIIIHAALLLLTLTLLPVALRTTSVALTDSPVTNLLWLLATSLGGPYLAVTTTTPLIQQWFSGTNHPRANDPYFLYAVSNAGSMCGLLAYPFIVEVLIDLNLQQTLWSVGYGLLVVMTLYCGFQRLRSQPRPMSSTAYGPSNDNESLPDSQARKVTSPVTTFRRLRWLILSFVPSAALLATTTRITTDVAAVPLFWVLPLAAYLATYINAFSRTPWIRTEWIAPAFLPMVYAVVWVSQMSPADVRRAAVEAGFFLLTALLFHGHLANDRPPARHLTEYYFWLALGGCLGGTLVGLIAPVSFVSTLEFPLTILIASLLLKAPEDSTVRSFTALRYLLLAIFTCTGIISRFIDFTLPTSAITCQMVGFGTIALFHCLKQPRAIAVGIGLVVLPPVLFPTEATLMRTRTFFSTIIVDQAVISLPDGSVLNTHRLRHGTTTHGEQIFDSTDSQAIPCTYYGRSGPLGYPLTVLPIERRDRRIAIIGLGTGALNLYSRERDHIDFYEIDPVIRDIASNPDYFTYLSLGKGSHAFVIGDGRLNMQEATPEEYDLIVLDAFGSDAIPVHLLTVEALDIFMSRLKPDGALIVHVSNRFLDLHPVLGAYSQLRGYTALTRTHIPNDAERLLGQTVTDGVVIAREASHLGSLISAGTWQRPPVGQHLWTDRHSSILPYLQH
jgi:hypothetical protein